MLLHNKQTGALIEVLDITALVNPAEAHISGQMQNGEEEQEPEPFDKASLIFPSGEPLPTCWLNADYRLE